MSYIWETWFLPRDLEDYNSNILCISHELLTTTSNIYFSTNPWKPNKLQWEATRIKKKKKKKPIWVHYLSTDAIFCGGYILLFILHFPVISQDAIQIPCNKNGINLSLAGHTSAAGIEIPAASCRGHSCSSLLCWALQVFAKHWGKKNGERLQSVRQAAES